MATSVLTLCQAAIRNSTANDAGTLATDSELIGQLNRDYQTRYALWALAAGDDALGRATLTMSGSPLSVTLPTGAISLVRIELASDGSQVNLIPVNEKDRSWHLAPAVYREGNVLRSRGQSGDPQVGAQLLVFHDDAPVDLTTLTDTLDTRFPARFEDLLVLGLALYLDSKDTGRDPTQHAALAERFQRADAVFQAVVDKTDAARQRSSQPKGMA